MSDTPNSNADFSFAYLADDENLDIAAIFGGSPAAAPNQPSVAPVPAGPTSGAPAPAAPAPVQSPAESMPIPPQQAMPAASPVETPPPNTPVTEVSATEVSDQDNPIVAAFEQKEVQQTEAAAKSLFEKAPVFSYGSTKEAIEDLSMTFEELRIAKSDDFPGLDEGKRVSWTVEYSKEIKTITDPKGTTIRSVKEEIERSKKFLDSLKKARDKNPDCLIKPKVTAQSKGIASYKGVIQTLEDAWESDKTICLIPSDNGNGLPLFGCPHKGAAPLGQRYGRVTAGTGGISDKDHHGIRTGGVIPFWKIKIISDGQAALGIQECLLLKFVGIGCNESIRILRQGVIDGSYGRYGIL